MRLGLDGGRHEVPRPQGGAPQARVFSQGLLLLLLLQDPPKQVAQLLDPKVPMETREAAVKELARTRDGALALLKLADAGTLPAELKATAAFACAASPDADVRAQAAQKLPLPKSKEGRALPPLAELLAMKGDAAAGGKVYRNPKGPNCIGCHQLGDEGKPVGPPLTTIANKLGRQQLFESVLTPSAAILMSYENWIVRTKDGEIKTGIKAEETEERITLKDSAGEYVDIPLANIADRKQLSLSMMPENITEAMTVQELVDLVEFLGTQK